MNGEEVGGVEVNWRPGHARSRCPGRVYIRQNRTRLALARPGGACL